MGCPVANYRREITDLIGLQSSFTYGASDRITAVTTPYGTTRISTGDKVAMAKAPGDPTAATDYSWMRKAGFVSVAAPQAIEKPLENRVWYNYFGGGATDEGTVRKVAFEGRVLR